MNNIKTIIDNPWRRRIILVSQNVKIEALGHDEAGRNILNNDEVSVIPIEEWSNYSDTIKILGGTRPNPGMLLVLSPYDSFSYSEISESRNYFAIEKMASTITLCQLLGAKSVVSKNIKIYDRDSTKDLSLDIESNKIHGKLTNRKNDLNYIKNRLQLKANFDGKSPNIEKATSFLEKSNLDTDLVLPSLVEMKRNEDNGLNKIKNLTQEISLTESLQQTFNFAAEINFPIGYIAGNYKSVVKEKIEISITLEINFVYFIVNQHLYCYV